MSISGIKLGLEATKLLEKIGAHETKGVQPVGTDKKESFGDMFGNAIREVDGMQKNADEQIKGLVLGKEGVTPHEAMIALEKADMAFQLMTQIRSKIIRAYEEVMRTAV